MTILNEWRYKMSKWISVRDGLPIQSNNKYAQVCVLTYDGYGVKPLIYEWERVTGKGKMVRALEMDAQPDS